MQGTPKFSNSPEILACRHELFKQPDIVIAFGRYTAEGAFLQSNERTSSHENKGHALFTPSIMYYDAREGC